MLKISKNRTFYEENGPTMPKNESLKKSSIQGKSKKTSKKSLFLLE